VLPSCLGHVEQTLVPRPGPSVGGFLYSSYKVQKTKSEFYADVIKANSHQPKKLWKVLSDMGIKGKSKSKSSNIGLVIEDKTISDKQHGCLCF